MCRKTTYPKKYADSNALRRFAQPRYLDKEVDLILEHDAQIQIQLIGSIHLQKQHSPSRQYISHIYYRYRAMDQLLNALVSWANKQTEKPGSIELFNPLSAYCVKIGYGRQSAAASTFNGDIESWFIPHSFLTQCRKQPFAHSHFRIHKNHTVNHRDCAISHAISMHWHSQMRNICDYIYRHCFLYGIPYSQNEFAIQRRAISADTSVWKNVCAFLLLL